MPIYTCTTVELTLTYEVKVALAVAISQIHSTINHVPSTYVNVVFHELPVDSVYTDGVPACPLLITGWVRDVPLAGVFRGLLIGIGILVAVAAARSLLALDRDDD